MWNDLLGGMFAGGLIGVAVYGVTRYVPAIGFGPLFGSLVGLIVYRLGSKRT